MKRILIGVLIGMLISVPIYSIANSVSLVGKRIETEVNVRLNGKLLETKAIAIEGTSYLPVRSISENLGLDVKYDSEKREVLLNLLSEDEVRYNAVVARIDQINKRLKEIASELEQNNIQIQVKKALLSDPKTKEEGEHQIAVLEEEIATLKAEHNELTKELLLLSKEYETLRDKLNK